ncbi:MAG: T9SS type A sorting domain-containing protein [bacterium]|nr:T9SS type A sorting domain-containing protein [bacterium]
MILTLLYFVILAGDFPISTALNKQWDEEVAYGGDKYLVVWEDTRKSGNNLRDDIWGQFVSKAGTLIDTNFPICLWDSGQFKIDVAFGDSSYLITWTDCRIIPNGNIYGQLVSLSGTLIDTPFSICTVAESCLAINKTTRGKDKYFVIWEQNYNDGDSSKLWGRFVSFDGKICGDSFRIGTEKKFNSYPDVASEGGNYLVIWSRTSYKGFFDIYGQLIDSTGSLIDTAFLIIEGRSHVMTPTLASNGTNYLVVADGVEDTLFGQVVGTDGSLVGQPILVSAKPLSYAQAVRVSWDGTNYLAAWSDHRDGGNGNPYGQWFSAAGGLADTNFAIIQHWAIQDPPRVASDGEGNYLIVYCDSRGDGFDLYGTMLKKSGVEEQASIKTPSTTLRASPNPFVNSTVISYTVGKNVGSASGGFSLAIYDIAGKLVESVAMTPSLQSKIEIGQNLKSGIYFVKVNNSLTADRHVKLTKIVKLTGH